MTTSPVNITPEEGGPLSQLNRQAIKAPDHVLSLLRSLHEQSLRQDMQLSLDATLDAIKKDGTIDHKKAVDDLYRDKLTALEPDKALFVYNLIRTTGALNVVECGTSFGVSAIYLALAVGQNAVAAGKTPEEARVIATEYEPNKAEVAREHWRQAGDTVVPWIELREGDLKQTLAKDLPKIIDFVLFDIWTEEVMPTLRLLEPSLRNGAVLITDNITLSAQGHAEFLAYTRAEGSPYTTVTLPFTHGLGMTVYNAWC